MNGLDLPRLLALDGFMANDITNMSCPIPLSDYPAVLMAHGAGGRLMNQLIGRMFLAAFGDVQPNDAAVLDVSVSRIAMTTDSFVVRPLFFPGGDIGSLAVHGTVNDLAMAGARPAYLSVSFILEEGLPMETLWRIVRSMRSAADKAGVRIVTGDTKVVERGHGDGLYINTTGVGLFRDGDARRIGPEAVRPGDAVILSGDIGRHGMAVMAARDGLSFEADIESDSADLSGAVLEMLDSGLDVRCLRDATRGGVAAVLNEIATASNLSIEADESKIAVDDGVRGACEILGFDPLHVANEGRFVAFVAPGDADAAVEVIARHFPGVAPAVIGTVCAGRPGLVTMRTPIGATRILDMPSGELLPRIC